jgi:hypothetical protein
MSEPNRERPLVIVSVFLFGKPAWEIDKLEGSPLDLELLSAIASCGQELDRRLTRAAEFGKKLLDKGWDGSGGLYSIDFYKTISLKDAEEELKALGIEPDEVTIREEEDEDSEGAPYGE